jgi:hypothetical protein
MSPEDTASMATLAPMLAAIADPQPPAPAVARLAVAVPLCLACLGMAGGAHWFGGCRFCSRSEPGVVSLLARTPAAPQGQESGT